MMGNPWYDDIGSKQNTRFEETIDFLSYDVVVRKEVGGFLCV